MYLASESIHYVKDLEVRVTKGLHGDLLHITVVADGGRKELTLFTAVNVTAEKLVRALEPR